MRVLVVGGGPAGLFFAGLLKRSFPASEVRVVEQTAPGTTYGFGVVFSESALGHLAEADPDLHARIASALETWQDLTFVHRDRPIPIDGNGFCGIARLSLLAILEEYACEAGVTVRHGERATRETLAGHDLVVGADGLNSIVVAAGDFRRDIEWLTNRFIWYGTSQVFDTLSLTFRANADGHFVAHHYRYSPRMSTFIVECDAVTFEKAGFSAMPGDRSLAYCERLFAADLGKHRLISNRSSWRRFPIVRARRWHVGNIVLIGDALRTVHFSIGSGTRLALEDAVALWWSFLRHSADIPTALRDFEATRRPVVDKFLVAAAGSSIWYEGIAERMTLAPLDLAYDYMTRSGRVDASRLRRIAPRFMGLYDADRPD